MKIKNFWTLLCAAVLCLCLVAAPAALKAQANTTGVVAGVITDPSGAAIPGATVLLIDKDTGATQPLQTNAEGRYIFTNVRLGNYTVQATKDGFQTSKVENQGVSVGATTTVNIKLTLGTSSQTVEV
ncbi:MAG TPA: carboxypeptidase-like regulatory domain-containing protein, partial [Terriglobales bacterium]|nr:carboxypeptidase-like regulatory domain-containing protein [Terriglobales bacterium]